MKKLKGFSVKVKRGARPFGDTLVGLISREALNEGDRYLPTLFRLCSDRNQWAGVRDLVNLLDREAMGRFNNNLGVAKLYNAALIISVVESARAKKDVYRLADGIAPQLGARAQRLLTQALLWLHPDDLPLVENMSSSVVPSYLWKMQVGGAVAVARTSLALAAAGGKVRYTHVEVDAFQGIDLECHKKGEDKECKLVIQVKGTKDYAEFSIFSQGYYNTFPFGRRFPGSAVKKIHETAEQKVLEGRVVLPLFVQVGRRHLGLCELTITDADTAVFDEVLNTYQQNARHYGRNIREAKR